MISQYATFGFFDGLATDRGNYKSMETNFLKVAIAQRLDRRSSSYSDSSPDLLVNFYIHTKEKIQSRSVPPMGYYGFRDPYYDTWGGYGGYDSRVEQFTEGTLNIEKTVDSAVEAIMAGFPSQP